MVKFIDLFNKEFLFEESKKVINIFYKLNINIIKKKEEENTATTEPVQQPVSAEPAPAPETVTPAPEATVAPEPVQATEPAPQIGGTTTAPSLSSVVTEDDEKKDTEKVEINDENNIVRKLEGQVALDSDQVDGIQSIEDIIQTLVDVKQDGVNILDDFTAQTLLALISANANTITSTIDKDSFIFADIYYGYSKDDSVGIRIMKRKAADTVSTSMLIDNDLVPSKFNADNINSRIVDYRNQKFNDGNEKKQ